MERPGSCPAGVRGFTLLELMIVVVVVAVLTILAVNSYQFAMVKSRRAAAKSCVQEGAQFMERFYTTHLTYVDAALPACSSDVTRYYTVGFDGTPDATTFTVQGVPTSSQNDPLCGTLSVNQAGAKDATGTGGPSACW